MSICFGYQAAEETRRLFCIYVIEKKVKKGLTPKKSRGNIKSVKRLSVKATMREGNIE